MTDLVPVRRAILSVSDKAGIVDFARALAAYSVEIVSTGGTARVLTEAGIPVLSIDTVTGFPEMMDGRVKTLHPAVHGALLALRDNPAHALSLQTHDITPIDLVCINLYPFEQTVARSEVTEEEAIEQIDIGGPSMIRSGAKNHRFVVVATDPSQYSAILTELDCHQANTTFRLRRTLAQAAYARTASYDSAIAAYLAQTDSDDPLPESITITLDRIDILRYGENPHQRAATYRLSHETDSSPSLLDARPLHGKPLSYNNLNDAQGALALAMDLIRLDPGQTSAVVVKHTNPCGAALAPNALNAIDLALMGDPLAAYGGILATSAVVDVPSAQRLCAQGVFLEVVVAAGYTDEALAVLRERWTNLRLLALGDFTKLRTPSRLLRAISGGMLIQTPDDALSETDAWTHRAGPAPDPASLRHAATTWLMAKHLTSNAIAIATGLPDGSVSLVGAGAGQMDRVTACRLAIEKSAERARGAIAASDAFFPFPDAPRSLIEAGVRLIIHPGGSKRDDETFQLCEQNAVTCLTTGVRHFRH